jgi:hypothetical protein
LGIDEIFHDAHGLGLIGQHPPSRLDEMPPPWVWLVSAGMQARSGAAATVSQRPSGGTLPHTARGRAPYRRPRRSLSDATLGWSTARRRARHRRHRTDLRIGATTVNSASTLVVTGEGKRANLIAGQAPATSKLRCDAAVSLSRWRQPRL